MVRNDLNMIASNHPKSESPSIRCAVCTKAMHSHEDRTEVSHGGDLFVVCCASCEQKFRAQPALYSVS